MNTSVLTGPSVGENPENVTGLEGSLDVTGLGPSYPPSSLQFTTKQHIAIIIATALTDNFFLNFSSIVVFY
jgi:hypothetical protein